MELIPAHTHSSYPQNDGTLCAPLNLAVTSLQKTVQKINELCNLRDLEITPVTRKNVVESNDPSTSIDAETSREGTLKEKNDMENLLKRLPILNQYFNLHNKIGEGTYSTVYLATLKNTNPTKSYAVKHLTQNCRQLRIEREFRCMAEIGGRDNVVHADYCLTSGDDCVTFIMPYLPHKKFCDYVLDMNADETRLYMKNLFIALKRVHSFNIIHRDVKPGNFLYNRETKQFLLVDFGLAQVVQIENPDPTKGTADENQPIDYSRKRKRKESLSDKEGAATPVKRSKRLALKSKDNNVKVADSIGNVNNVYNSDATAQSPSLTHSENADLKSPVKQYPTGSAAKTSANKTPLKSNGQNVIHCPSARRKKLFEDGSPNEKVPKGSGKDKTVIAGQCDGGSNERNTFTPLATSKSSSAGSFVQVRNSKVVEILRSKSSGMFQRPRPRSSLLGEHCFCSGKGAICATCSSRSKMVAPRAGTPGFRPPEVLFKYVNQTTAVDMWAAGVILLCILSGCYPFFKSPTDLAALAEIMTVFGTEPVFKIAAKFGRRVVCSSQRRGVDLKKLCNLLRARVTRKTSNSEKRVPNPNDVKCSECSQIIRKDGCLCLSDNPTEEEEATPGGQSGGSLDKDSDCAFPDSAFDLLKRLLDLDPTTRITAAQALEHPFILGH